MHLHGLPSGAQPLFGSVCLLETGKDAQSSPAGSAAPGTGQRLLCGKKKERKEKSS